MKQPTPDQLKERRAKLIEKHEVFNQIEKFDFDKGEFEECED